MVLVAAPAGYGKTTFLTQWEDADERPFAWISLDERYNDPVLLLGSIAAAVDEIEPLSDDVFAPLQSPRPDLSNVVMPRVCQALRQCERPFVIVLDDLHNVHNPEALGPLPSSPPASTPDRPWRSRRGRSPTCRSAACGPNGGWARWGPGTW